VTEEADNSQGHLFEEDRRNTSVPLESPAESSRHLELQRLSPADRVQGLLNFAQLRDVLAAGERVAYIPSRPCQWCGSEKSELGQSGSQLPVRCGDCGRIAYNAPKTEVGFAPRTVRRCEMTFHRDSKHASWSVIMVGAFYVARLMT
jgi:hypothetical protein